MSGSVDALSREEQRTGGATRGGAVGERVNSKLGRRLVTGNGRYVDDVNLPGMLHARFVRSPHAHARIVSIDTSAAEAMKGVELVWTAEDIEPYVERYSHPANAVPDEDVLTRDRVRYVGDEVAVVLAKDRNTAVEAAERVEVEYERLEPVLTPEAALADGAPLLHPDLDTDPDSSVTGNVAYEGSILGSDDIDAALAAADVVVEGTFRSNKTNPSPLEPHGIVARYNAGDHKLTVWASSQMPHRMPELIADAVVDLEPTDIVCKLPDIGGGFGSKCERFAHDICVPVLAMATRRPVKMFFDRIEELQAGRGRYQEEFDLQLGLTSTGEMLALDVDMTQNTGAYANFGKVVAASSSLTAAGPYLIPDQEIRYRCVYTNVMPGIAVRGFGNPQFMFAVEQLVDMAADELGMDAIDLRLTNMADVEDLPVRTATGLRLRDMNPKECLRRVREMINWDDLRGGHRTRDGKLRGVGIGTTIQRNGNKNAKGADYAGAIVRMDRHGQVTVFTGMASIGQGSETGIVQIVADTLGVSVDRVTPVVGDTDVTPEDMGVWADRTMIFAGTAAARAAEDMKATIVELAGHVLRVDPEVVVLADDRVFEQGNPDNGMSIEEFAHLATYGDQQDRPEAMRSGVSLVGEAKFETEEGEFLDPETNTGSVSHAYTIAVMGAAVEVDPTTGEVEVVDVASVEDAGTIINPKLAEGQVQGGIVEALGEVLLENYAYDGSGALTNGTLVEYHLPTAADVPLVWSESISHVETPDPTTSHGQKGLGESATVTTFPAVANAVADATGIRFTELPLSPARVLLALVEHGKREL